MLCRSPRAAGCAALIVAAAAWQASALSLDDLDGGGSFVSTDGSITFENFEIEVTPKLSQDLTDYLVIPADMGWNLIGPIGVADGAAGDLKIIYEARGNDGFLINGGSIFFNGLALVEDPSDPDQFASANIQEEFFSDSMGGNPSLSVAVSSLGLEEKYDEMQWGDT